MSRPIDADALIDAMTGACNIFDAHGVDTTISRTLISIAGQAPTIEAEPRWISVEERLPDNGTRVLCYCRGNQYDICHFQKQRNAWFDRSWNGYMRGYVTHWMPLPEPPKEEEKP